MRNSLNFNQCKIKNINIDQSEKKYEINVLVLHAGTGDSVDVHQHFNSTVGDVIGLNRARNQEGGKNA